MSRLKNARGAIVGAGLLAIALIGGFEGLRLYSYQDVIGVWTGCYGETKGMHAGLRFTRSQCDAMFVSSLEEHERGMRDCLTAPDALPDKVYVSFLSLTYNIGIRGFCRSTLARYANDNQLVAACNELPKFNRAGGKEVRGLTLRRAQERKLCLEGARAA